MHVVAAGVVSAVARVVRKAALAADQTAVLATPVVTGRARANWIVTVGSPSDSADAQPDPSGQAALAQGQAAVGEFEVGRGEAGSIFVTNNVEYIIPLENGHSAQAPSGMSAQAILAAVGVVRHESLLKE